MFPSLSRSKGKWNHGQVIVTQIFVWKALAGYLSDEDFDQMLIILIRDLSSNYTSLVWHSVCL